MPSPTAARMVGREAVLERLRTVVAGPAPPTTAVVRGEPGFGKSVLLAALAVTARSARLATCSEAAQPFQQAVPYALVADVFDLRPGAAEPARAELGRLVVGEEAADPYARVLAVTEGLVDFLGAQGTTALLIDDLHQADRLSLLVLDRLLRRAPELDLRAVLATRPTARAEVLTVVDRVGTVIELQPLTDREADELIADVLGGPPGPNLLALARGAAGNPLYVTELARAAAGQLVPDGERLDLPARAAPRSFRATVLGRMAALPAETVAALRAGAVLGTTLDTGVMAALRGTSPLEVMESLGPAVRQGLVIERADGLAFRHELVRDALYRDMPPAVRAELHRLAATALAGDGTGAVATHLQAAGAPYTAADLDALRGAAESILRVDGRRAAELLSLVLDHTPRDAPERVRLRARRAHALVLAGDLEEAAAELLSLERDGSGTDLAVGLAMLEAQGARDQPDAELASRLWAQAASGDDRDMDVLGLIAYHAARANASGALGDLPADTVDLPPDARIHFLLVRAMRAANRGDLVRATELARHAYTLALDEPAGPQAAVRAAHGLGMFAGDLPQFRAEAIAALENATRWAESANQPGLVPIVHSLLSHVHWAAGDWDQAEAACRACVSAAEDAGVPRWQADGLLSLSHLAAARGESRTARALLAESGSVSWQEPAGRAIGGWVSRTAVEARILFGEGRDAEAVSLWTADLQDPLPVPASKAISAMDLTVAGLSLGDHAAIAAAAGFLEAYTDTGPPVGMIRPLVLAARDSDPEAAAAGAEAARPAPVYGFAKLAEIAGLVARDAGDHDAAIAWLREALACWERCGAVALRQRTAAWLRGLGVHTRGRTGSRALTGWNGLTDAELRVAAVVAEGLLYREVAERLHLSRRTVETHVASAMRKLDLRNRSELVAEYWRQN